MSEAFAFLCIGMVSSTSTKKIPPISPPDIGTQLECFVTYAHTPNEFYIQLVCNSLFVILCVAMGTAAKHATGNTNVRTTGLRCRVTPLDNYAVARDTMFSSIFVGRIVVSCCSDK